MFPPINQCFQTNKLGQPKARSPGRTVLSPLEAWSLGASEALLLCLEEWGARVVEKGRLPAILVLGKKGKDMRFFFPAKGMLVWIVFDGSLPQYTSINYSFFTVLKAFECCYFFWCLLIVSQRFPNFCVFLKGVDCVKRLMSFSIFVDGDWIKTSWAC